VARREPRLGGDDPLWPGLAAWLCTLALYVVLPPKLTIGPSWLVPATEIGLFVAVLLTTLVRVGRMELRREVLLVVVLVGTLANVVALCLLTHYMLAGGHARGVDLIRGGAVIWGTNLLLFAIWYWMLDSGGPRARAASETSVAPHMLFPQMTDERYAAPGWKPRFGDYLYVSLTNQAAFSPTDTMPLTLRVKLLMGIQGIAALTTVVVIVARAVNILA
jgi:hypothetical protein